MSVAIECERADTWAAKESPERRLAQRSVDCLLTSTTTAHLQSPRFTTAGGKGERVQGSGGSFGRH
jgi:hypothetical protein